MAAYEVLLLNTAIPQIQAAQSGDTYLVPRDIAFSAALTLSAGTANGVPYLNASKVLTTGSALTFDGTNLDLATVGAKVNFATTSSATRNYVGGAADGFSLEMVTQRGASQPLSYKQDYAVGHAWSIAGSDAMTLTSTGLGIGTNNPAAKLDVRNGVAGEFVAVNALNTLYDAATAASSTIRLGITNSAGVSYATIKAAETSNDDYPSLVFGVQAAVTTNPTERARISSDGTFRVKGAGTAGSTDAVQFSGSAPASAMTLDSSGRLLVGVTSGNYALDVGDVSGGNMFRFTRSGVELSSYISSGLPYFGTTSNTALLLMTNNAECARITSGGYFKASDNGSYNNVSGTYHELYQSTVETAVAISAVNASFANNILQLNAARNTTNNSFYALSYYNSGAGAYKLRVADSGDVTNTNGTYGTISDAKMKTDIVDAGSQWPDIKALRFRKFKMKDDPSGLVQLGVVAQEVELTSPGLVDEHADKDAEGNDLGTTTKSVKTSVLLMKAAVALQEAMARIEKLEAEVATLKGA